MKKSFKVAKYNITEEGFQHAGYDEYTISFLHGLKPTQLRIVVNGVLTNQKITLSNHPDYKIHLLGAISEFKNNTKLSRQPIKKSLTTDKLFEIYNKKLVNLFIKNITPITKEERRDTLTKFQLF